MIIISHRGYWKSNEEKNTPAAFERSFRLQYGTETDIRDCNGGLVISHDVPSSNATSIDAFFTLYNQHNASLPLALNIKCDGLQTLLKNKLTQYNIANYFVFDMSVPDTLGYIKEDMNFYTRHSEYEAAPAFYEQAKGVWLDAFQSAWYTSETIQQHLNNEKHVAIVSPELHKREHLSLWSYLKKHALHHSDKIILCTDLPEDATQYFK